MHKNVNLFYSNEMNLLIAESFKSLEVLTFFPSRSPEILLVKDISFWFSASATKLKLVNKKYESALIIFNMLLT